MNEVLCIAAADFYRGAAIVAALWIGSVLVIRAMALRRGRAEGVLEGRLRGYR